MTELQLEEIGLRIRKRREEMKLTQEQAAELLDISLTHYKNIEHGRGNMSVDLLMVLCEEFELDPTYLLTGMKIASNPIMELYKQLPDGKKYPFEMLMYYLNQLME